LTAVAALPGLALDELAESRRQLDDSQALAHIGSWTWDRATDTVRFSDEQYRIYGLEPQCRHVDLDTFLSLIHPEDRGMMRSAVGRAFRTGEAFAVEHRLAASEEETRWIAARCEVWMAGGEVVRMVGTCQDITERKRYEQALQDSLAEVRASRARIVEAADLERKRVERDLHDGAQQRLVTLAMSLRVARARLGADADPEALAVLDELRAELQGALAELRDLARGIHPAVLTEQGLRNALESLVLRTPLPAQILSCPRHRLAPMIETGIYYLVAEALTNAIKHADASVVTIAVTEEGGTVVVEVRDDGRGGAAIEVGTGLRGLDDRVASLDGVLTVVSPPGGGTCVSAELPCA
jgi:PAS domain S-box-containing protein